MKKRVLSLFLALALCISTQPMTTLAEEAGVVTEQEVQSEESAVEAYTADEDISGGNIGSEDVIDGDSATKDAAEEKDAAVQAVQALIDALPEEVTAENAEAVSAQLAAIDEAMAELTEEQIAELDMTRLNDISEAMSATVAVQADGHTHTNMDAWNERDSLPNTEGCYYLTTDVTLTDTWKPADGTILCLNGYSITLNKDNSAVIIIDKNYTFTLNDGTDTGMITHGTNGSTKYTGKGVVLGDGAKFNMYGGTISGNDANGGNGGGVFMNNGSAFNMYGGKITGNTAAKGGGVYNDFGNTSGSGTITVGGTANITGNTGGNVNLRQNQIITIDINGLESSARIGVTMESEIVEGETATVAKTESNDYEEHKLTEDDLAAFISDAGYKTKQKDYYTVVFANGEPHVHAVCGTAGCTEDGHDDEVWKCITKLDEITGDGSYYLKNSVTLDTTWTCEYNVKLCLNGMTITASTTDQTITVAKKYSLDITDCREKVGAITHEDGKTGGGLIVWGWGSCTLWNGAITGNNGTCAVYVADNGSFKMNGGSITENKGSFSGGVHTWGTFEMNGGSITKNVNSSSNGAGGGVGVASKGTFTMTGGEIAENTGNRSGGVCAGGTFTMTGGDITGNINGTNNAGGGVYVADGGKFNLTGDSSITGNKNTSSNGGAGVYVADNGTFTMDGGDITGNVNTSSNSGAGVYVAKDGAFTMDGGAITSNENRASSYSGGGVYINSGTFIMNGGSITGNTSESDGGGVYVAAGGTFTMTKGKIAGNTSLRYGGGVNVASSGTVKMSGGEITGNNSTTTVDAICAGGVYVASRGNFIVSGTVRIQENYKNGTLENGVYVQGADSTKGNLYLAGSGKENDTTSFATITIEEGLTEDSRIDVSKSSNYLPTPDQNILIATGADDRGLDYTQIFGSDVADQDYTIGQNGSKLYLMVHQHSWNYTLSEDSATITATCEDCDESGSITLEEPAGLGYGYDGKAKIPGIVDDHWQGPSTEEIVITYMTEDGTVLEGAPVNAGTYVAGISLKGADDKTVTASLKFTISKARLKVIIKSDLCKVTYGDEFIFPDNAVYYEGFVNGEDESVLRGKLSYDSNYEQGSDVDEEYVITLGGLDADNYNISYASGTLTVIPRTVSFKWENTENRTYNDEKGRITATVEGLISGDEDFVSAVVGDTVLTAGTHTVEVTGLEGIAAHNYKLPDDVKQRTCTYEVDKAAQTLKYPKSESGITYSKGLEYPNTLDTSGCHTSVTYSSDNEEVAIVKDNGNVRIVGAGTARITATTEGDDNYDRAEASFTLEVAKCPVIISGVSADDKTYDGKPQTTFDIDSAVIEGAEGTIDEGQAIQDAVEIDTAKAAATFEDADAGKGKTVTFSGFVLSGNAAGNYELSKQPAAATNAVITPAVITVTPDAGKEKVYGKDDPKLTYTYSGEISGEEPSFTGVLGRTSGEDAGSYVINRGTLALQDNGSFKAGNYTLELSGTAVNFTINKAKPVITVESRQLVKNGIEVDITKWASFTNNDSEAELIYELAGEYTGITLTGNMLKAANAASTADSFQIRVTAAATKNFTEPDAQMITVKVVDKADAEVSITGVPDSKTKTYGDEDFTLTASSIATDKGIWIWTSTNSDILEIISGADTATPVIKVKKLGEATLTATYSSDGYYGSADVIITVAAKTVTAEMIADIPAQEYTGSAIEPAFEVKDGKTTLTFGKDYEFSYSDNIAAGKAVLTIKGMGNYTGTADKTFTILPKSISGAFIVLDRKSFAYNGGEQMATVAVVSLDGKTLTTDDYEIKSGNKATDASDSITLTIEGKGNYTGTATTTWEITKIDPVLADFDVAPDLTADLTYNGEARIVTVTTRAGMGGITVKYNGSTEAPTNVGSYDITIDVKEGGNYKVAAGIAAGTLTITKAAAPRLENIGESCQYAKTGEQTVSIADLVPGATGYTLGEADGSTETITNVSVSEAGVAKYTLTGTAAAGSTVTIPVKITSMNYEDTTVNVVITITKATPTGKPGYNVIHDSSRTLKDAGLDLINSTLDPKEGKLEWIDSEGNVLPDDTKMEEGRKYIWRFTPADLNYEIITGEIELYAPYRILDGADSSWTQDTDGTIAIRGDGEFSKFLNVKVDGAVIDASNYIATEGSTIITLKADYLKTLSEGSHTFELVWADGSASTNFTVAANTSDDKNDDNDDDSSNNGSNNDIAGSNSASNNNTVPGQITSPKTGDASGIWTTLFMVSIAGLAAMLARRKRGNNE